MEGAPRRFGDLGRRAIYFQGHWGALVHVIILEELGSKLIVLEDLDSHSKSKKINPKKIF